ncbi:MAG: antitoxin [Brevibacterium sp.]|uniref:antitoxin n=1 Tax=Brevibacterium sp. TaxID=1701 RepID=UPI002647B32F|nr:antitoxin [Brevibacterium sp.]MDN5806392.1 antitoxin [Brevibacterium sp.]MDN5832848.1 antitoxin [Brevibacterium sp.]MDN5875309.1 antitoxin [Brevibacterium sp.]MDN5908029.1 antitoxin [Brevibacterium sp.]MDN6134210.1 antitoxin [Brevibacterium sp.]
MSFDKFVNKAKNLADDPKVRDKLNSEKAEKASDSILDKAAGVAESLTNGKHTEKIQKARDAADRAVGTDGNSGNEQSENENTARERPDEGRRDDQGGPRP